MLTFGGNVDNHTATVTPPNGTPLELTQPDGRENVTFSPIVFLPLGTTQASVVDRLTVKPFLFDCVSPMMAGTCPFSLSGGFTTFFEHGPVTNGIGGGGTTTVPEPGTWLLLLTGLALSLLRIRLT
jgi:hypothetical protein